MRSVMTRSETEFRSREPPCMAEITRRSAADPFPDPRTVALAVYSKIQAYSNLTYNSRKLVNSYDLPLLSAAEPPVPCQRAYAEYGTESLAGAGQLQSSCSDFSLHSWGVGCGDVTRTYAQRC